MDRFVSELLALPALDVADEQALARRARAGDRAARDALITSGMRSVVLRARMRGFAGDELRDAVQAGAVGLIRAVDRFDPDHGARLATFAWHWVGAEMRHQRRPEVPLGGSDLAVEDAGAGDLSVLDGVDDDLADVLRLRFGIGATPGAPMSRREVGEALGMTVAQVRGAEAKAMRQVRRRLAKVVHRAHPQGGADPP